MNKNLKIKVMVGIPGSGKSTLAKQLLKRDSSYIRINRDDFRFMFQDKGFCEDKVERLITEISDEAIKKALGKKFNVIIDNTHCRKDYLESIIEKFGHLADIEFQVIDVDVKEAIRRDSLRDNCVGVEVIKKMHTNLCKVKDSFDFRYRIKTFKEEVSPNYNSDLKDAVIFDIDGTLALMNNKRGPFDWEKVHLDDPNHIVLEQIKFHENLGRTILFVSGRDESCRDLTVLWINEHCFENQFSNNLSTKVISDHLFMRPKDDYRKDTLIKKEIYENHIKDKYNVLCVYDDRLSVVKAWNEMGLYVFCVNQGLNEF